MTRRGDLGLRCAAALLLVPLTVLLCGGPLASSALAQRRERDDRLAAIAARIGLAPAALRDPETYARAQAQRAEQRRQAALTRLPKHEPSIEHRRTVEQVEEVQALRTLAGLGRDRKAGVRLQARQGAAVERLRARAERSGVRLGDPLPPIERPAQRLKAAPGGPRAQAPASWRSPLRTLRSVGGRLRYIGGHMPRFTGGLRGLLPFVEELVQLTLTAPADDDLAPTIDAQSDHPLIVQRAEQLGNDPVRIYNFVQDTIATELYAGSKKGAVGTLREGRGNHVDQASLLVALYRAAGIPARYEIGTIAMTAAQANEWAGTLELSVSASLIGSAGIPNAFISLGPDQGVGLSVEHVWVRAWVPTSAYRGIARPGAVSSWVHLAPSIKGVQTQTAVDLRDAVLFDFDGYLAQRRQERPVAFYEAQLRTHVRDHGIACETLDAAQPKRTIAPDALPLLPADLPVRRISELASMAALPADMHHRLVFTGRTSQNTVQFSYTAPMASLWGKSVSVVYEPATQADADTIASYGGLENTPAYEVQLRAALKVDAVTVAQGASEAPGLDQRLSIDMLSPATGTTRVEHALIVSGVYGMALDPGLVPSDLIPERVRRYEQLTGDDLEAEKLYVTALTYFHDLGRAREQAAGLHWHRIYKEIEEAAAMLPPRVEEYNGVPLSVSRDFFTFDAPGLRFGEYSIDGNNARSVRLTKLVGYESSVLEHEMSKRFRGSEAYSAVALLQVARESGVQVLTISQGNLEEGLLELQWPDERETRVRDFVNRGYTVQVPIVGYSHPQLGTLHGFIATQPSTGAGAYIVGTLRGETHGAECLNGSPDGASAGSCSTCPGSCAPGGSQTSLCSGNFTDTVVDLTLPARGLPLRFARTYNSVGGWTHNFSERLIAESDGSLTYVDGAGIEWTFAPDAQSGRWAPPPKLFQRIDAIIDGYEMSFKDGLVARFDAQGRLSAYEDLNGHDIALEYDASSRLARVVGMGGNFFAFGYDSLGRMTTVSDSVGRSVQFTFDAAGLIETETDVLGHVRAYSYDAMGRMRTKTDRRGHVTSIDYDDLGRVVRVHSPLGHERSYAYDPRNGRAVYTDRRGFSTIYEFDANDQPTRITDPLGNERVMTFDGQGNKLSEQDARGNITSFSYDADGNLLTATDPLGAATTFTYNAFARLLTTTDAAGHTATNTYDAAGNLLTSTDALGNVTSYTYTADGLPETITRPGGAGTAMTYDAVGNVLTMTDAEGGVSSMTYDAAGHVLSTTDPDGDTTTMVVDAKGQMLQMQDSAAAITSFSYDADGNRTSSTDPDGAVSVFQYDALSRMVATTDGLGQTTRTEHDPEGNVIARIDARGFRSEMQYDALGRLIRSCDPLGNCSATAYCAEVASQPSDIVDPLGNVTHVECDQFGREASRTDPVGNTTATHYDLLGRRTAVIDPAGHSSQFGYDALGRLVSVTDAQSGVTSYGYDARGNRSTVTDANGHTTLFDYDLADRLARETTPISTGTDYGYDASGRRTSKLDGKGQTTEYVYDAQGRLVSTLYAGGSSATFAYDLQGRRIFEQNQDSTREMSYDALGRLVTVVDVDTGRTIEYGYDETGNRTSMAVQPDGDVTTYAWDGRGLLSRMTDPEGGVYRFSYDALGRRVATSYPNGMVLHTIYDDASRVLGMVYVNPARQLIELFGYQYDNRGNRTAKIFGDGSAEQYGYDELNRLTRVTYPSGRTVHYEYDAVGNRMSMVEGSSGSGPGACAGDADCDGVLDTADNCPAVQNADQQDSDSQLLNVGDAVATYRFEEASGTTALDGTGTHNAALVNSATRTAGRIGQALSIPTTSGYLSIPNAVVDGRGDLTLETWVRTSDTLGGLISGANASSDNEYLLYFSGGALYTYVRGASQGVHLPELSDNQWHHVAWVRSGTENELYVDGQHRGTRTLPAGALSVAPGALLLAQEQDCAAGCLDPNQALVGQFDEVAFFSRALTPAEVQQHAQTGLYGDGRGDACDACPSDPDRDCAPLTCADQDGDGYGPQGASACDVDPDAFDCDDQNAAVHPDAVEACDGADNDCDGQVDEQCLVGAQTTTYAYNAFNQLLTAAGPAGLTAFAYDGNGNQTQKVEPGGTTQLVYDARDRMVAVHEHNGAVTRYGYDTNSLRVQTVDAHSSKRVLLDGFDEIGEINGDTLKSAARFDRDPSVIDSLLAQHTSDAKYHAVNDALGSVYGLTNDAAALLGRYAYDAFGARHQTITGAETAWGFAGRRHDTSGALYLRERYLSPTTGLFLSEDPVNAREVLAGPFGNSGDSALFSASGRLPRYHYGVQNPALYRDPTGRFAQALLVFAIPGIVLAEALMMAALVLGTVAVVATLTYFWTRDPCEDECRLAMQKAWQRSAEIIGRAWRYYVIYHDADRTHYQAIGDHQRGLQRQLRRIAQNCSPIKSAYLHGMLSPLAHFPFPRRAPWFD